MTSRILMLAAPAVFALGCVSSSADSSVPPPTRSVVRTTGFQTAEFLDEKDQVSGTLPRSATEVWAALQEVYEELGIPVTQRDPSRMVLANPAHKARTIEGRRMGRYLDCGTSLRGALANIYDVTVAVGTHVRAAPGGGATVTTILEAWAEPRTTSGNPVHCRSKNTLEQRIMERLTASLGAGIPEASRSR
jgi:hypothetical protein